MMKLATNLFYGATSLSAILGAALMWSWWDLAFYSGIFYNWNQGSQAFITPMFAIGMAAAGIIQYLLARYVERAERLLLDNFRNALLVGLGGTAFSLISIIAGRWGLLLVAIIASAGCGVALGLGIALWGCVCAERGAKSAIVNSSLAIAIGVVFDGFVLFALKPYASALAMSAFPLLSMLIYACSAKRQVDAEVLSRNTTTRKQNKRQTNNFLHREIYGVSIMLVCGLLVSEAAFNFMNYHFAYEPFDANLQRDLYFNYGEHAARGVGALVCFIAVGLCQVSYKRFFWAGTMAMCAAYALMPFFNIFGIPAQACNYLNMACFALVAIFELAVFCEISYVRKTHVLESVGFGMIFMTGAINSGLLPGMVVGGLHLSSDLMAAIMGVVGYVLIFGLFAAVSEGQRYLDPETGIAAGRRLQTEMQNARDAQLRRLREDLVKKACLTVREQDILDELLNGYSALSIASSLGISENTVKSHTQSIYKKLNIHGRQEMTELFQAAPAGADADKDYAEEQHFGCGSCADGSNAEASGKKAVRSFDEVIGQLAGTHGLTARETEVFALLARGFRHKEIQERLFISSSTVHSHVTSIYTKMGLHSRDDLSKLIRKHRNDRMA